jgi:hypothetical protein
MTILYGVQAGDVAGRRSMAAFGNWLDDAEVTNLANYVFTRFGNSQVRVAAADVHQMRAGAQTSETLMVLSTQAFFLACAGCLVVLAWLLIWRRIRRIFPPHVRA